MEAPVPVDLPPISLAELKQAVAWSDPGAVLVRPVILRRVIREDRRLVGFRLKIPHRKSYVIGREALLEIVDAVDLDLAPGRELPERVVLIEQPSERELAARSGDEVLVACWRLLFHGRVHVALEQRVAAGALSATALRGKISRIGVVEFDEIRTVLAQERMLLPPVVDTAVYVEFAAVYLELRHFAATFVARYFPALEDVAAIDALLSEDVDAETLYQATRPQGAPDPTDPFQMQQWEEGPDEPDAVEPPSEPPSEGRSPWLYRLLLGLANRAERSGNLVRSAIYLARAARRAPEAWSGRSRAMLRGVVQRLVDRLLAALELRGESSLVWREPLLRLVEQAAAGVWTAEARLLYVLQKVCLDSEREISTVDLVEWVLSRGRRPIVRPLPNQREVLMSKHLSAAMRRLATVRMGDAQRRQLSALLHAAAERVEAQFRRRAGPRVLAALDAVGLKPANLPERVAQKKLSEELLDRVVERGFVTLGDLRDAMSRNTLKLPDLARPADFFRGDRLLEADRRLAEAIDGVYRRGEFYLRWMQRLSALAFGTRTGRFLTRYAAVPFGGAYLALAGVEHVVEFITHRKLHINSPLNLLLLGLFLLGLLYVERFRRVVRHGWSVFCRLVRAVAIDLPCWIACWPVVRQILDSRVFLLAEQYVLKPAFWAAIVCLVVPFRWTGWPSSLLRVSGVFLAANLVLNSRLGREMEETVTGWIVESWHRYGVRLVTGLFYYVWDLFAAILGAIERALYEVAQWLWFRSGQGRGMLVVKGLMGFVMFFVTYVVRFGVNLLIEPQINPIKHFPVVTVSHKLLLPMIPSFAGVLALTMEKGLAITVATAVITSIPGIFGFLVWELKENWRLYAANRADALEPVLIGHHGETMGRLLRPGIHSGTIPKRYARLRRAERRARRNGAWKGVRKQMHALEHIELSVRRYVDREFLELLAQSPQWDRDPPVVEGIRLGTNRVQVRIRLAERPQAALRIRLETKAGWIVAGAADGGLMGQLTSDERGQLALAMVGLFKTSGAELVRQQIEAALAHPAGYDFRAEGLVAWFDPALVAETLYDLRDGDAGWRRQLLFAETRVRWEQWVAAWGAEPAAGTEPAIAAVTPPVEEA
jgi:hypothetical protein